MQSLKINSTLQGGKYKIIAMLGQGGFGITYLAENTQMEDFGRRLFGEHLKEVARLIYAIRLMEA